MLIRVAQAWSSKSLTNPFGGGCLYNLEQLSYEATSIRVCDRPAHLTARRWYMQVLIPFPLVRAVNTGRESRALDLLSLSRILSHLNRSRYVYLSLSLSLSRYARVFLVFRRILLTRVRCLSGHGGFLESPSSLTNTCAVWCVTPLLITLFAIRERISPRDWLLDDIFFLLFV